MNELKLIVGLGNPGARYDGTRHNVGFSVLDKVAERAGIKFKKDAKWEGETARLGSAVLLKPLTFMNESGRSVGSLCRFYRWQPEQVLVVFDDVALPLGTIRFKQNGGHGGHNGVRSLIQHFASENFPRLKIGIEGAAGEALVGHVLGNFKPDERELVENTLATAADAVQVSLSSGIEFAANQFNVRKTKPQVIKDNEPEIRRTDRPEHHRD